MKVILSRKLDCRFKFTTCNPNFASHLFYSDHVLCLFQSPHPFPHLHPHPELLWKDAPSEIEKEDIQALPVCWGAIACSNYATLKFREPVYSTIRELAMSYFDFYFTLDGVKTLRSYSDPIQLHMFLHPYREKTQLMHRTKGATYKSSPDISWMFDPESLEDINYELSTCKHYQAIDPLRRKAFYIQKATPMLIRAVTLFTKPDVVIDKRYADKNNNSQTQKQEQQQ